MENVLSVGSVAMAAVCNVVMTLSCPPIALPCIPCKQFDECTHYFRHYVFAGLRFCVAKASDQPGETVHLTNTQLTLDTQ